MTSDFGALGRPRSRLTAVFARYRYAVAALDQMALSIFGFALNICLLRTLPATDYGIVSLWMTMSLFAVSVLPTWVVPEIVPALNSRTPGTTLEPSAATP